MTADMVTRCSKIALTACIGLYLSLVVFDNISDYGTNFEFVKHVMQMDTTLMAAHSTWRSIWSPTAHHIFYIFIIIWELVASLLCWAGTLALARRMRSQATMFNSSKGLAIAGLVTGMLLWLCAFISIGGEWFMMWQSAQWNGQHSAQMLFEVTGVVLIYVALPDADQCPGNDSLESHLIDRVHSSEIASKV